MAKLQITLVRSLIGRPETQRATVQTLGLRKIQSNCCSKRQSGYSRNGQSSKPFG